MYTFLPIYNDKNTFSYLTYFFVCAAFIFVMYMPFVYVTINTAISLNHGSNAALKCKMNNNFLLSSEILSLLISKTGNLHFLFHISGKCYKTLSHVMLKCKIYLEGSTNIQLKLI